MIGLGLRLARASVMRSAIITGCSAAVSAMLLVAVSWALLPWQPQEPLIELVNEPIPRFGAVVGAVLGTMPLLYLHHQVARLGTALRQRRFASMRLVGATLGDVRRLVAVEVGAPALLGAVLGTGIFAALRSRFVTDWAAPVKGALPGPSDLGLIPAAWPAWWCVVIVIVAVTVVTGMIGVSAAGQQANALYAVARHAPARPPRPIGVLLLTGAGIVFAGWVALLVAMRHGHVQHRFESEPLRTLFPMLLFVIAAIAAIGILSLPSWIAHRLGRLTEPRASSAAALVAARRSVSDPRAAGRAAATIGAVATVAGGTGAHMAALLRPAGRGHHDLEYSMLSLVPVCALMAVLLVVALLSQLLHALETTLDAKRSYASLVAMGLPSTSLTRSQVLAAVLVTLPTCVVGVLVGSVPYGVLNARGIFLGRTSGAAVLIAGFDLAIVVGLVIGTVVAVLATGPWLRRATSWQELRTE